LQNWGKLTPQCAACSGDSDVGVMPGWVLVSRRISPASPRKGDTRVGRRATGQTRELEADFEVTDEMLDEFRQLVQGSPIPFDESAWQTDLTYIKAMIRREIDVDLFGAATAYRNLAKLDPQLQYALGLFPEAQQLLELSRQPGGRRAAR
jgi:hypothetical protein